MIIQEAGVNDKDKLRIAIAALKHIMAITTSDDVEHRVARGALVVIDEEQVEVASERDRKAK